MLSEVVDIYITLVSDRLGFLHTLDARGEQNASEDGVAEDGLDDPGEHVADEGGKFGTGGSEPKCRFDGVGADRAEKGLVAIGRGEASKVLESLDGCSCLESAQGPDGRARGAEEGGQSKKRLTIKRLELDTFVTLLPQRLNSLHHSTLAGWRGATESIREVVAKFELLGQCDIAVGKGEETLDLGETVLGGRIAHEPRAELQIVNGASHRSHSAGDTPETGTGRDRSVR